MSLSGTNDRIDATHTDVNSANNILEGPTGIPLNKWLYLSISYASPTKTLTVDDFSSALHKSEVTNSEGPFECTTASLQIDATLATGDYVHLRHLRILKEALTQG